VRKKKSSPADADKIELYPDAWDRFQQAVHVMVKAGPQHRIGGVTVKSGAKHREAKKTKKC
jgi:hypothetical protein